MYCDHGRVGVQSRSTESVLEPENREFSAGDRKGGMGVFSGAYDCDLGVLRQETSLRREPEGDIRKVSLDGTTKAHLASVALNRGVQESASCFQI